jgi:hypothetical protein
MVRWLIVFASFRFAFVYSQSISLGSFLGGAYTMQLISPTIGSAVANPNLTCTLGDSLTFYFPMTLPTHPFSIYSTTGAVFPGVTQTPFTGVGGVTFKYV